MKYHKGNFKTFEQHAALYWPEQLAEAQGLADCFGQEQKSMEELSALDIIINVHCITSNGFSQAQKYFNTDSERKRKERR